MAASSNPDPQFRDALDACVIALPHLAAYELNPVLERRMLDLGERKEFLSPAEHEELLALVDFAQKRSVEKLEATLALERLSNAMPGLVSAA
jgi:hypothetical protein